MSLKEKFREFQREYMSIAKAIYNSMSWTGDADEELGWAFADGDDNDE